MPEIMTAQQLADRLHVRRTTVTRWARAGKIPRLQASRYGASRFEWADVMRALDHRGSAADLPISAEA
jgi:excisionase family DNA binding protein